MTNLLELSLLLLEEGEWVHLVYNNIIISMYNQQKQYLNYWRLFSYQLLWPKYVAASHELLVAVVNIYKKIQLLTHDLFENV